MKREFTGYIIKEDYDLNNLNKYGFWKTEPKNTNPWWQRPFNVRWSLIGTWDSELLVSKNDRKLLMEYKEDCNMDMLNKTIEEMKLDDVFIDM